MENQHPHLELAYDKTLLVIESCQTKDQLENASRMVKNFKTLYREVGCPKSLYYNLDRTLHKKYGSLSDTH